MYFSDIDMNTIKGSLILLDIDGTLLSEGDDRVSNICVQKVRALKEKNEIYLCSNRKDFIRDAKVSELLGIPFIESPLKKPNKKLLDCIPSKELIKPLVVIGDKFWTDGRFASRIEAQFVKVDPIREGVDCCTKMTYFLDKLYGFFFLILWKK